MAPFYSLCFIDSKKRNRSVLSYAWDYIFPSAPTESRGLVVPDKLCHFNNFLKLFVLDLVKLQVPDDIICTKSLDECPNLCSSKHACGSLVNVKDSIELAMNIINNQIDRCGATSGDNRVPPLVVSRLARGGKSPFLRVLFHLLEGQGYVPIVINFNGPFARRP